MFLDFDGGVTATLVLNGYGHFDIAEFLWWSAESGGFRSRNTQPELRRRLRALGTDEQRFKAGMLYGAGGQSLADWSRIEDDAANDPGNGPHQHFFGLTIVSCERGDIRQSPKGLFVYDADGCREIALPPPRSDRAYELDAIYDAIVLGKSTFHDATWGAQTVAILQAAYASDEQGREVAL
jgi:phthalate 4,5-cis-dihydrodiol dehydrogenase